MWLGAMSGQSYEQTAAEIQRIAQQTKGIGLEDLQVLHHQGGGTISDLICEREYG